MSVSAHIGFGLKVFNVILSHIKMTKRRHLPPQPGPVASFQFCRLGEPKGIGGRAAGQARRNRVAQQIGPARRWRGACEGPGMRRMAWRSKLVSTVVGAAAFAGLVSAQSIVSGPLPGPLPLFPSTNWWNQDISSAPVDPGSAAYINFIGSTRQLHPDFGGEAAPGAWLSTGSRTWSSAAPRRRRPCSSSIRGRATASTTRPTRAFRSTRFPTRPSPSLTGSKAETPGTSIAAAPAIATS